MKLDEELDRLYGSPLSDFTRIRNDLAKELGRTGEREAAAKVRPRQALDLGLDGEPARPHRADAGSRAPDRVRARPRGAGETHGRR